MTAGRFAPLRIAALAGLLVAAGLPSKALGHARLVKSQPPARATLDTSPPAVRLWFNERLEPDFARIVVTNDEGESVTDTPAHVDSGDPKALVLELPSLSPGTYSVTVEVLSVDGHRVKQSFPFTVKARSAPK